MHQIVLSPNERQSLLHTEGMCGIGAIIPCNGCSEERREQLSDAVVQGIRNRGPDSLERGVGCICAAHARKGSDGPAVDFKDGRRAALER